MSAEIVSDIPQFVQTVAQEAVWMLHDARNRGVRGWPTIVIEIPSSWTTRADLDEALTMLRGDGARLAGMAIEVRVAPDGPLGPLLHDAVVGLNWGPYIPDGYWNE